MLYHELATADFGRLTNGHLYHTKFVVTYVINLRYSILCTVCKSTLPSNSDQGYFILYHSL